LTVYLVGAGPGHPGLITVRGAEVLARAEVVVHDRLADSRLLSLAPEGAERIDVGKAPGGPVDQESINRLLVEHGQAGRCVVRLKGGDPYVFGRGGEEALALQAAGIAFEVVPGITSAVAVAAYGGVPVTHRGLSTSFTVVTGHSRHAVDSETNWDELARAGGTIVVLMGVAHRAAIAERLLAGGLPPTTPVAAVHWGTRPEQVTTRTTLAELGNVSLDPPVTLVIGRVASLRLDWYERLPLFGRTVVVTRARHQASALSARLAELGARPVEIPVIELTEPADGGAALRSAATRLAEGAFEWLLLTSANGVDRLFAHLPDSRAVRARVAAIGPGTAEALARYRVVPDLVPERYVAEGLLDVFPPVPPTRAVVAAVAAADTPGPARPAGAARILLARAEEARDVLPDGLRQAGWDVEVVPAYRTVLGSVSDEDRRRAAAADAVCFTASSTVRNFLARQVPVPPTVVCIGPVTAATATEAGLRVDAVAGRHDLDGLVEALVEALSR
jgi:uroporphyrinogen III methyltransferase/synthase